MSNELCVALVLGALLTMVYFFWQIRKNRLQIGYAVSWSIFSLGLVILAIFPNIVIFFAEKLGVISPANLLYLIVLFVLIIKQFSVTIKLSKLNQQITELTQAIALKEKSEIE